MSMQDGATWVFPGMKICRTSDASGRYIAGHGTYELDAWVIAALCGRTQVDGPETTDPHPPTYRVSISRTGADLTRLPRVGDRILGQVQGTTPRFARVAILAIEDQVLPTSFPALIRLHDVMPATKEPVPMHLCYQPWDIIQAEVISLGDLKAYWLSTAKPDLGVVEAKSAAGAFMTPISAKAMRCRVSGAKETRKVAALGDDRQGRGEEDLVATLHNMLLS